MRKRKEFTNVLSQSLWCEVSVFLKITLFSDAKGHIFCQFALDLGLSADFFARGNKGGEI